MEFVWAFPLTGLMVSWDGRLSGAPCKEMEREVRFCLKG
jgi:hypothetical protein